MMASIMPWTLNKLQIDSTLKEYGMALVMLRWVKRPFSSISWIDLVHDFVSILYGKWATGDLSHFEAAEFFWLANSQTAMWVLCTKMQPMRKVIRQSWRRTCLSVDSTCWSVSHCANSQGRGTAWYRESWGAHCSLCRYDNRIDIANHLCVPQAMYIDIQCSSRPRQPIIYKVRTTNSALYYRLYGMVQQNGLKCKRKVMS